MIGCWDTLELICLARLTHSESTFAEDTSVDGSSEPQMVETWVATSSV
jgi:hypothetical protein